MADTPPSPGPQRSLRQEDKRGFLQKLAEFIHPGPDSIAELIGILAEGGIQTRDDLADLAVDELTELTGLEDAQARELIMKAREHWFTA